MPYGELKYKTPKDIIESAVEKTKKSSRLRLVTECSLECNSYKKNNLLSAYFHY